MKAIEIAAIGLRSDQARLEITAHNVANLATVGFKRRFAVQSPFADWMAPADVVSVHVNPAPGKVKPSTDPLDISLPPGRFLMVEADDGNQFISREGMLRFDASGTLRNGAGMQVLGNRGVVSINQGLQGALEIDEQGQLRQQGKAIDSLRLINLKTSADLRPLGNGLYAADPQQWDADTPASGVLASQLEQSNVVPAQEMLNLTVATRHAESMVRLIQTADDMEGTAIRRLSENS